MPDNPLDLTVPRQAQTNWCWAATTVGVHTFVHGPSGAAPLSQSTVVNRQLDRFDCCLTPENAVAPGCNVQSGLTLPLFDADCHEVTFANTLSFGEIMEQIDRNAPLCVRVVWEQGYGEGHFAVIIGYILDVDNGIADVVIDDSFHGRSVQTYRTFRRFYRGQVQNEHGEIPTDGRWTHSYYVRPQVGEPDA